jgi:phosphoenolpyruvate-protein kinase (PTS system EI component)
MQKLISVGESVDMAFQDAQEFEFTVENGELFMLQTRTARRTDLASLRTVNSAREFAERGTAAILMRTGVATSDIAGIAVVSGLLTASGGRTSHAAVVARQMGKVCLVGCLIWSSTNRPVGPGWGEPSFWKAIRSALMETPAPFMRTRQKLPVSDPRR